MYVNTGMAGFSDRTGDVDSIAAFNYVAYGTGTTAAANTQTALVTETDRVLATAERISVYSPHDTVRLKAEFTATGSDTVAEIGVFNASSAGVMAFRTVIDNVIDLTSGKQFIVIFDFSNKEA